MSSSIPIPPQASSSGSLGHHDRKPHHHHHHHHLRSMDALMGSPVTSSAMSPSPSASSSSSSSSSTASPSSLYSAATPPSRSAKGKEPISPLSQLSQSVPAAAPTRKQQQMSHKRRPSLLSSAILHQEANVINIGDPDGAPRLISYLSSSQGFIWNPEIFVPSYVDYDYTPLENRREPIVEIFLSDEEIQNMFPE